MKNIGRIMMCLLLSVCCIGCSADRGAQGEDTTTPASSTTTAVTTEEATESESTAAQVSETATTTQAEEETEPVLMYQAHRGVSTDFPENTLPAFQGAIDQGFRFIELDPNFTKDQQCVLMHDATINRTCRHPDGSSLGSASIALSSVTYAELSTYDAGLFKGAQFKGTKVPLLSEVAALVEGTGVALKLDNKIWNYTNEQLDIIFTLAENSSADIGFTCKSMDQVERVAARLPQATIHYDGAISPAVLEQLKPYAEGRELYIWVGISGATEKICERVREVGHLGLWTLATEKELEKAISLGAEVIETNGELKPPKK